MASVRGEASTGLISSARLRTVAVAPHGEGLTWPEGRGAPGLERNRPPEPGRFPPDPGLELQRGGLRGGPGTEDRLEGPDQAPGRGHELDRQGTRELTAPLWLQAHPPRRRLAAAGLASWGSDGREHGAGRFPGRPGPASGHGSRMVPGRRGFGGEIPSGPPGFSLIRRRGLSFRRRRSGRSPSRGLDPIPGRGGSPLHHHPGSARLGSTSPTSHTQAGTPSTGRP